MQPILLSKKILLLAILFFSASHLFTNAKAESEAKPKDPLLEAYEIAQRNQRHNPTLAISQWQNHYQQLEQLSPDMQFNWHIFTTNAYLRNQQYLEALELIGQIVEMPPLEKTANQIKIFNMLGVIYSNIEQNKNAVLAWQCALPQIKTTSMSKAQILNNIATVMVKEKRFARAFSYYQQAIQIATLYNNITKLALYNGNLGYAFMVNSQPHHALLYLKKALFLTEKQRHLRQQTKTALFLLNTLIDIQDWTAYDRHFNHTEQKVTQLNDQQWSLYFDLIQTYAKFMRHNIPLNSQQKKMWQVKINIYSQQLHFQTLARTLGIKITHSIQQHDNNQAPLKFVINCH